jgi:hypothetical protein
MATIPQRIRPFLHTAVGFLLQVREMKGLTARSDRPESCTIRLAEVRTFTAVLINIWILNFYKEIKVLSPLITKLSNFSVGIMVVCESFFSSANEVFFLILLNFIKKLSLPT